MNIKIVSNFVFDETLYDKAYGLAKSTLMGGASNGFKKFEKFRLTCQVYNGAAVVVIRKYER